MVHKQIYSILKFCVGWQLEKQCFKVCQGDNRENKKAETTRIEES